MQRKPEGWNVVLAGFWNRMIFTPEWVGPRLFPDNPQIETVVALLPVLPIIFRDHDVAAEISNARIICRPRDLNNVESIRRAGTIAGALLKELPETPLQGLGINFGFRETGPASNLLDLFNFADNAQLAQAGWEPSERRIVRQLQHENDTLNLTLSYNNDQLDLDCNFHIDPAELEDTEAKVAAVAPARIIELRDRAIALLDQIYGLQLEDDNHDDA